MVLFLNYLRDTLGPQFLCPLDSFQYLITNVNPAFSIPSNLVRLRCSRTVYFTAREVSVGRNDEASVYSSPGIPRE